MRGLFRKACSQAVVVGRGTVGKRLQIADPQIRVSSGEPRRRRLASWNRVAEKIRISRVGEVVVYELVVSVVADVVNRNRAPVSNRMLDFQIPFQIRGVLQVADHVVEVGRSASPGRRTQVI